MDQVSEREAAVRSLESYHRTAEQDRMMLQLDQQSQAVAKVVTLEQQCSQLEQSVAAAVRLNQRIDA